MLDESYPLISVIVPVYNAEKYLQKCIDSILNQSYPNIEIILVNDGSTDNSPIICDEYQIKYTNVKVHHKTNGGQSSARNMGLDYATGEYVGFIDSDDWVLPDMYTTLYDAIARYKVDVSQIETAVTDNPDYIRPSNQDSVKVIDEKTNILRYYLDSSTRTGSYSVCRCLIPAKIAKKYRFREGKINEDIDYKFYILSECERLAINDKICYCYFQSGQSTTSGILKERDFDLFEASHILKTLTEQEDDEQIRFLGSVKEARAPFSLLCRSAYYGIDPEVGDLKQVIKKLTKAHRKNLSILLKAPLPINRKIIAVLLAVNFKCLTIPLSVYRKLK